MHQFIKSTGCEKTIFLFSVFLKLSFTVFSVGLNLDQFLIFSLITTLSFVVNIEITYNKLMKYEWMRHSDYVIQVIFWLYFFWIVKLKLLVDYQWLSYKNQMQQIQLSSILICNIYSLKSIALYLLLALLTFVSISILFFSFIHLKSIWEYVDLNK